MVVGLWAQGSVFRMGVGVGCRAKTLGPQRAAQSEKSVMGCLQGFTWRSGLAGMLQSSQLQRGKGHTMNKKTLVSCNDGQKRKLKTTAITSLLVACIPANPYETAESS